MSKVVATNVIPDEASDDLLTIGAASDAVAVNDSLNVNTLKDMGGNTIFVSDGSGTITSKNSGFPGALQLISTQTASDDASISFTSGIDSTYDVYCFKFYEINPATDGADFQVNFDNQIKTTTFFKTRHGEDDTTYFAYRPTDDLAQSTAYQNLTDYSGSAADRSSSGELWLFGPSSTTYVKHFYSRFAGVDAGAGTAQSIDDFYMSGYVNITAAVDEVDFKMSSGNFDGIIKLYGISKS
jgi:hypothetical protein